MPFAWQHHLVPLYTLLYARQYLILLCAACTTTALGSSLRCLQGNSIWLFSALCLQSNTVWCLSILYCKHGSIGSSLCWLQGNFSVRFARQQHLVLLCAVCNAAASGSSACCSARQQHVVLLCAACEATASRSSLCCLNEMQVPYKTGQRATTICELFTDNTENNKMQVPYRQDREQQNVSCLQTTQRTTRC